ncbi:MAG: hypothetical protein JNL70_10455 [Saprospiraceae bacterium]|nr:hypothetical protein [Saprospiraceae bacterium]
MMKNFFTILTFLVLSINTLSAQDVVGNYEREKDFMSNPTVLMLKTDGQFELVTGATSLLGTYTLADGKIAFTDVSGNYPDRLAGIGTYEVITTANGIRLKAIKDKAIQRKDVLSSSNWKKVGNLSGN